MSPLSLLTTGVAPSGRSVPKRAMQAPQERAPLLWLARGGRTHTPRSRHRAAAPRDFPDAPILRSLGRTSSIVAPAVGFCPSTGVQCAEGGLMGNDIQMLLEGIGEELGRPLRLPPLPVDLEPFPNQGSKPNLFGSSVAINGRHYLLQD